MYKRILICSKCGLKYGSDKRIDNGICPCCVSKKQKEYLLSQQIKNSKTKGLNSRLD